MDDREGIHLNTEDIRALQLSEAVFREKLDNIEEYMVQDRLWKQNDAQWKRENVDKRLNEIEKRVSIIQSFHRWVLGVVGFIGAGLTVMSAWWEKIVKVVT